MKIRFFKKIKSTKKCINVFNELKKSLNDSNNSKLWPNKYSSVKMKGKKLEVIYKLGINYKTSYNVKFSNNKIVYSPTNNHPLKGEVIVEFKKKGNGCVISWKGEYNNANLFHYLFFKIYSFLFFKEFKNNIKWF